MNETKLRLNGRLVPVGDYASIKKIAGVLYGVTPINMPAKQAMKIAMDVAMSSLTEMRRRSDLALDKETA